MIIVGIDPGLNGGVAAMDGEGTVLWALPMPVIGKAKKEIHTDVIEAYITVNAAERPALIVIEQPMPAPGRTSVIASLTIGIGVGRLLERFKNYPRERPSPTKWKNALFGARVKAKGNGKHDPKAVTLDYVRQRWPGVNLRPGKRTKDHDGIADAICLAEWGRRLLTGAPR